MLLGTIAASFEQIIVAKMPVVVDLGGPQTLAYAY